MVLADVDAVRFDAMDKRSHLGMAGHYAAMAEFLYRGYNVAVPSVDVGDDVYVVEDLSGAMWRLQVKTSDRGAEERHSDDGMLLSATRSYSLSRGQLLGAKRNELFYMFVVRWEGRWRFLLVPRPDLRDLRKEVVARDRVGRPGPRPLDDQAAKTDAITMRIEWLKDDALAWGRSLRDYLDRWPDKFPENPDGPGAIRGGAPSPDPEIPPAPAPPSEPPTDP